MQMTLDGYVRLKIACVKTLLSMQERHHETITMLYLVNVLMHKTAVRMIAWLNRQKPDVCEDAHDKVAKLANSIFQKQT